MWSDNAQKSCRMVLRFSSWIPFKGVSVCRVTENRINRSLCLTTREPKGCREGMWQGRQDMPRGPVDCWRAWGHCGPGCTCSEMLSEIPLMQEGEVGRRVWCECWATVILRHEEGWGASLDLLFGILYCLVGWLLFFFS